MMPSEPRVLPTRTAARGMGLVKPVAGLAALLLGAPLMAQEPIPPAADEAQAAEPAVESAKEQAVQAPSMLDGYIKSRYRVRQSADDRDMDFYQYLRLDVARIGTNHVSAHLYGRATVDIEGQTDAEGFYVFDNINDINDTRTDARLYYAHVDATALGPVELVRAGRQLSFDSPMLVYFDGARVESRAFQDLRGLKLGAFGGVPVHLFEQGGGLDLLGGGFVEARPWLGGRVRVDTLHVGDSSVYGDLSNNHLAATVWHQINPEARVRAQASLLDWAPRGLELRGDYIKPQWGLLAQAVVYRQLQTLGQLVIDFDPYYVSLREESPYWQGRANVGKELNDHLSFSGGVSGRKLADPADEGAFNHDLFQGFVTASAQHIGIEGLSADLSGVLWRSHSSRGTVSTVTGDVRYEVGHKLDALLGSSYAVYQYDFFTDAELEDVRSYFLRLRARPIEDLRVDLGLSYEDALERSFTTANISIGYDL